ncbi:MAG: dihydrodipicolinate synthase family protein [Pseudomonadota bacterium]
MTKAHRGIYAAAVTPFHADGSVDQEKLIAYCRYLLSEGGCDGVAPTGTTGEGNSIAFGDRLALPSAFAKAGLPANRVVFGTGSSSIADAIKLTNASLEAGFNNVLILPPFYYKNQSDEGIYSAFAQLINDVGNGDLRIYLYHFPQMSLLPFSVELVLRLKRDFGQVIAGLKDSSGDFSQSKAFAEATGGVNDNFDVYPSSEAFVFDALAVGCAGIISGSTNAFANKVQAALAASNSEQDTAMAAVKAARETAAKYPLMSAMKQVEAWRTGDESWTRMAPPLLPLTSQQKTQFKSDLAALEASIEQTA